MGQAQLTARRLQKHRWLHLPLFCAQPFVPRHRVSSFTSYRILHFILIFIQAFLLLSFEKITHPPYRKSLSL